MPNTLAHGGATLSLLLGLALSACDPAGNEAPQASLDQEITALKARESDPIRLEAGYRALLARFGHPVADAPASIGTQAAEEALGKAAAAGTVYKIVKDFEFTYPFAYHTTLTVAANATITAAANRIAAPTDPVIVAYHKTSGSATAYLIDAVHLNDDKGDGSLNAYLSWTNKTGATVKLEILVYAYSASTTGMMQVILTGAGGATATTARVMANPVYKNSLSGPFEGCGFPLSTRIRLSRKAGGGFMSGLFALNRGNMRGGMILESAAASETLKLPSVLTNGAGSFLMGVMLDIDQPVYEESRFRGTQFDEYTCN